MSVIGGPRAHCAFIARSSPSRRSRARGKTTASAALSASCLKLMRDAALGDGVKRHFFTLLMEKLHHGFELDIENCGKTLLFNGEDDHKVPSTSRALLDGDLFIYIFIHIKKSNHIAQLVGCL